MAGVSKEYKTISQIAGPLVFVKKTEPIAYGELVSVKLSDGSMKRGEVLDSSDDIVVVQIYEGTSGIDRGASVRFLGETMKMPVSKDMLGRILTGAGEPLDGGPAITPEKKLDIAKTFFEQYDVDALTVAPYMGEDSVTPFLQYEGKWVILLALTSNKGSHDFQLMKDENGERLFEKVLKKSQEWGNDENMMYVVGATQGQMFEDIRKLAPNHFLLVPGVGAQGGSLEEVCKYGMIKDCGLLVNSSRGIIYASNEKDFAEVAGEKAKELQQQMAAILDAQN